MAHLPCVGRMNSRPTESPTLFRHFCLPAPPELADIERRNAETRILFPFDSLPRSDPAQSPSSPLIFASAPAASPRRHQYA